MRLTLLTRWYVYGPVAIILLGLVLLRARPVQTLSTLSESDWRPLALAIALNGVVIGLWVVRSGQLLRHHGHRIPAGPLALLVTFANTASSLTPASTGEIARVVLLERRHGVPLGTGTAVVLVERFMALYLMAITTGLAWVWLLVGHPAAGGVGLAIVVAALAFAPTIAYRAGLRPLDAIGRRLERSPADGRRRRVGHQLVEVDARIAATVADARRSGVFIVASLAIFALFAAQFALAAAAIGEDLDLATAWAIQGVAIVVGVLSAIPFGLGVSDAAIALLLPTLSVDPASAALIALLFRAVSTLPVTLLGIGSYVLLARGGPTDRTAGADAGPS